MSARTGNQLTHGRPRMKAKAVKSEFARLFVQGMTPMPKLSDRTSAVRRQIRGLSGAFGLVRALCHGGESRNV